MHQGLFWLPPPVHAQPEPSHARVFHGVYGGGGAVFSGKVTNWGSGVRALRQQAGGPLHPWDWAWSLTRRLSLCPWKQRVGPSDHSGNCDGSHVTCFNPHRVSDRWGRPQAAARTLGRVPHCPLGRARGGAAEVGDEPCAPSLAFPPLDAIFKLRVCLFRPLA